jgi:hypothetical protein
MMGQRDPFRESAMNFDGSHPDNWIPEEGDLLLGQLVRYSGPIQTEYGKAWVAIIMDEDTGKEWSLWLMETVLVNEWTALAPDPGERVAVKYLGLKSPRDGGKPYKNYFVQVDRRGGASQNPFRQATPVPSPQVPQQQPAPQYPAAPPRSDLERLSSEWENRLRKFRVESWAEFALAQAHPQLEEDPDKWGVEDFTKALSLIREHGAALFTRAASEMGKREPADPELVREVSERAKDPELPAKDRLRIQEALDSGWQDAVSWALIDVLDGATRGSSEPEATPSDSSLPSSPSLSEPDDDLPF